MSRLQIGFETIREILGHRLHQECISNACCMASTRPGKAELFFRITELLRRTTALADIANRSTDTLSLDVLLPRLMEVVTEALNADRSARCSCTIPTRTNRSRAWFRRRHRRNPFQPPRRCWLGVHQRHGGNHR
ncbi:MAG: hypothetical protein IPM01_30335 [Burkholderiaceae bacterium]|nr:hypothetical protein [Burkholderiaceae bacterium]